MATFNEQVNGLLGGLLGGSISLAVWILVIIAIIIVVGGLTFYFGFHKRRFDILVKVTSRRAGENREFFDKGAILHDKRENIRYLRLFSTRVDLPIPKFNILRKTNWGDYVEILRSSEKGFRFITPPKVDKEYFYNEQGKLYPISQMKSREIEGDVTFILQRERSNKKILEPESIVMKLIEHIPAIFSGIISLMMLWIIFQYAPQWFAAMEKFVNAINQNNAPQIVGTWLGVLR